MIMTLPVDRISVEVTEVGVTFVVPRLLLILKVMPVVKLVPVMAMDFADDEATVPTGEIEVIVEVVFVEEPPPPPPPHEARININATQHPFIIYIFEYIELLFDLFSMCIALLSIIKKFPAR